MTHASPEYWSGKEYEAMLTFQKEKTDGKYWEIFDDNDFVALTDHVLGRHNASAAVNKIVQEEFKELHVALGMRDHLEAPDWQQVEPNFRVWIRNHLTNQQIRQELPKISGLFRTMSIATPDDVRRKIILVKLFDERKRVAEETAKKKKEEAEKKAAADTEQAGQADA